MTPEQNAVLESFKKIIQEGGIPAQDINLSVDFTDPTGKVNLNAKSDINGNLKVTEINRSVI